MKKINPILIASILLLSASAQANMPVGGYNSESSAESGALVSWFIPDIARGWMDGHEKNDTDLRKRERGREAKAHPEEAKKKESKRKKRLAALGKTMALGTDKALRKRAEMEYSQRHKSSKYR
jgi:hypothetical protein